MKDLKKYVSIWLIAIATVLLTPLIQLYLVQAEGNVLYVNRETIKVYEEPSKDAYVMDVLNGAKKVKQIDTAKKGKWLQVTYKDKYGGTSMGWVVADQMTDSYPQSLCPHKYEDWIVETEPTCTEEGYEYRFCKYCGIRDERSTEPLGHKYGDWSVRREATCTKQGQRVRICKRCGYEQTEDYLADHKYGEWTIRRKPTCTETGLQVRTCKVCNGEETREIEKLPHDFEYKIITEATDHSAGTRIQVCKVCGYKTEEESFDPEGTMRRNDRGENVYEMQQLLVDQGYLNIGGADGIFGGGTEKAVMQFQQDQGMEPDGVVWPLTRKRMEHEFGPWKTTKEMNRVEAGERTRVCKDCGFEQHETIEPGIVFERGRRGEDIRALQQMLKQVGCDVGSIDGIYGKMLDAAMAKFAAENHMVVEEGKIHPADVDAVVNAWIKTIPEEEWKGEGTVESPVNLALTVTPSGEMDDDGVVTYGWSLTNIGSEKAIFNVLLLSFGDAPDFRENNLAMLLDGVELLPDAGNSAQGSFRAKSSWETGNLNFAAMAVSETDGTKWLSNSVSFENLTGPAVKTILPAEYLVDVNHLPDGIYPVAFDRGDVTKGSSGIYMNAVHIYTQDWYDPADIGMMEVGDTIVVENELVPVLTIDRNDVITVNDEQDARAFDLVTEEDSNGYRVRGFDDMATYTEQGVTTLMISPETIYMDASNPENDPVTAQGEEILEAMQTSANEYFNQYNTTVRVEAGRVAEINRIFVP